MLTNWFFRNNSLPAGSRNRYVPGPIFWLGIILILGTVLRVYDLGTESYWIDEVSTVIEGQQSIPQLLASGRLDQPPGYYLPFHFWIGGFGTSEVSTRAFSLIVGVASIGLIFLVGRELFGSEVGLLGAFFMAVSDFQIFFSQEARFYSFFEFTTLLSFFCFVLALKRKRVIDFVLYGLAGALLVYSHTYGIFILVAQNLFVMLQVRKYKAILGLWLASQVLIALAFGPYLFPLVFGGKGVEGAIAQNIGGNSPPSVWDPIRAIYHFILPARRGRTWASVIIGYTVAVVFLVTAIWLYYTRWAKNTWLLEVGEFFGNIKRWPGWAGKFFLVGCWLLCPIVLPLLLSLELPAVYAERYTVSAAPALYLLLAAGVFNIRRVIPIVVSLGVLVIAMAPGLYNYYVTDINEQWREAAVYINENAKPDEVLVFAPNMGIGIQQKAFDWYYHGPVQSCGLGVELVTPTAISEALKQCISDRDHFWLIIPNYQSESVDRYRAFFFDSDFRYAGIIKEQQLVGISIYLFRRSQ